jgi:hypothetical protein
VLPRFERAHSATEIPLSKGVLLRILAGIAHSGVFKAGCDFMELGLGVDRHAPSIHRLVHPAGSHELGFP